MFWGSGFVLEFGYEVLSSGMSSLGALGFSGLRIRSLPFEEALRVSFRFRGLQGSSNFGATSEPRF